jgi:hypothetical protein
MDRPHVLVAHPLASTSEAIAAALAETRDGYLIRLVPPCKLEAALAEGPRPVVVCGEPTPAVQARARGWIALHLGGQNVALVGGGDCWRVLRCPSFAAIVDAVDELVAQPVAPIVPVPAAR